MNENDFDVVVVGGGAAGLSAALVLGRARRRIAVVDAGMPRNAPAAHMQGFLSRDGMAPADFLAAGRLEVANYGVELVGDQAAEIEPGLVVRLAGGRVLNARRVLVATGVRDELPDIPGVRERWGRDLLHCPYCHGWEVRHQPLGVLGTVPGSVQHAQLVRQWSDDVVFFAHTYDLTAAEQAELEARGVQVVREEVAELVIEDDRLVGVELIDGRVIVRTAVFIRPYNIPHADGLLAGLGCELDDAGFVTVDATGRTSTPGVWAAGNVVDPRAQVITAAGAGSAAAIAINADLVQEDVERALSANPPSRTAIDESERTAHGYQDDNPPARTPPPSKHQLALMIWLCVFPTLLAINLAFEGWLRPMSPVLRTFVLATIAVPIVIYGLMPRLHRLRQRLLSATYG